MCTAQMVMTSIKIKKNKIYIVIKLIHSSLHTEYKINLYNKIVK